MWANREDEVAGGRPFELFFKSGDMNDVLKSLTMVDLSNKTGTRANEENNFYLFIFIFNLIGTSSQTSRPR